MSASKKLYEAVAREFDQLVYVATRNRGDDKYSASYDNGGLIYLREAAHRLSIVFARDNPRFDAARFMRACGFDV